MMRLSASVSEAACCGLSLSIHPSDIADALELLYMQGLSFEFRRQAARNCRSSVAWGHSQGGSLARTV